MRRIFAQTRKELAQIVRDYRTLTLALLLPLGLLLLLGSAISLTVDDLPIVVQDLDNSPASHAFIGAFRSSITLRVVPWPVDRRPEDALVSNEARAALIVPANFGRDIARGLAEFNGIIKWEAARRGLKVVDIFALSQKMKNDSKLTAPDGLHPSAKEYGRWEEMIFPVTQKLLNAGLARRVLRFPR